MSGKPGQLAPQSPRRRELGLCLGCPKDAPFGQVRCFDCRVKRADKRRADYAARKAARERTA